MAAATHFKFMVATEPSLRTCLCVIGRCRSSLSAIRSWYPVHSTRRKCSNCSPALSSGSSAELHTSIASRRHVDDLPSASASAPEQACCGSPPKHVERRGRYETRADVRRARRSRGRKDRACSGIEQHGQAADGAVRDRRRGGAPDCQSGARWAAGAGKAARLGMGPAAPRDGRSGDGRLQVAAQWWRRGYPATADCRELHNRASARGHCGTAGKLQGGCTVDRTGARRLWRPKKLAGSFTSGRRGEADCEAARKLRPIAGLPAPPP
jgi:hypothetical protein